MHGEWHRERKKENTVLDLGNGVWHKIGDEGSFELRELVVMIESQCRE